MRTSSAVLMVLVGCGGSPGTGASSNSPDAASTSLSDASPALVAKCEALAMTFVQNCHDLTSSSGPTPDTARMCIWSAYAHICRTGNTQLLLDSMECFGQNTNCWTFSDSNNAATCLATIHATRDSEAAAALTQTYCASCYDASCPIAPTGHAELYPYVSDGELATIASCQAHECTAAAIVASCASVPDVTAIFGCH